jgi:hypothetical protein
MYSDPILEEKRRVQKKLAMEAGYDIKKLAGNMHTNIIKLAEELKVELKYSQRKGSYICNNAQSKP